MRSPYTRDEGKYIAYYMNQAGGELPRFIGASTQYGQGLGGIFRNLFRMAMPLLKRGLNIVKPHLKTAATNIVGDVVSNITKKTLSGRQDGNRLMVYNRRPLKRPPTTSCGRLNHLSGPKRSRSPQDTELLRDTTGV